MSRPWLVLAVCLSFALPTAAFAETLREDIARTAFLVTDKNQALAEIGTEIARADAAIAANPQDQESRLQRGVALGYRAKLTRNRGDAIAARQIFETLSAADPRNPELHLALATWHLDSVDQLGGLIAGAVIGAKKSVGEAELDKAIQFGRDRAFILGAAALLRIRTNEDDLLRSRQLAEAAQRAPTPSGLDRLMKRSSGLILPALVAGDGASAKRLAKTLMPFGKMR